VKVKKKVTDGTLSKISHAFNPMVGLLNNGIPMGSSPLSSHRFSTDRYLQHQGGFGWKNLISFDRKAPQGDVHNEANELRALMP